jgi:hypothetical protein
MAKPKSVHETVMEVANRKPKLKPGKATECRVSKADDDSGYTVHTQHEDGGHYEPSHESVHKTLASVHKHMKTAFEGNGPKDDDDDATDSLTDNEEQNG